MAKPRMIIADTDISYIIPLQKKIVEEFFDKIDVEIITESDYFEMLFSAPQKIDVLIVCEELYSSSLHRHNIGRCFLMTEQYEEEHTGELNVNRIFKYTSIKEILNEIIGKSSDVLQLSADSKKDPQIVLVCSGCGGVGKTTLALAISQCMAKNYKNVLYLNAAHLQSFQNLLDNPSPITATDVYAKLTKPGKSVYQDIKHIIRQEQFHYLPPFKAPLMALGLDFSLFEKIALEAKRSLDYDYVVIDAEHSFNEQNARLIDIADRVIVVTKQTRASVYATNLLASNINGSGNDKYIYICNDFHQEEDNALISPDVAMKFSVVDYVNHIPHYEQLKLADIAKDGSVQRAAYLIL